MIASCVMALCAFALCLESKVGCVLVLKLLKACPVLCTAVIFCTQVVFPLLRVIVG